VVRAAGEKPTAWLFERRTPEGRMLGSVNMRRLAPGRGLPATVSETYPSVSSKNVVSRFQ